MRLKSIDMNKERDRCLNCFSKELTVFILLLLFYLTRTEKERERESDHKRNE